MSMSEMIKEGIESGELDEDYVNEMTQENPRKKVKAELPFEREELRNIRERAEKAANNSFNPYWREVYLGLVDATNKLDELLAKALTPFFKAPQES